nr:hypothetical protein [Tanacetum cinerariifolium]
CIRTRSKSYPFNSNATIPRRSNNRRVLNIVEPEIRTIEEVVSMADRTMEELLQEPTEGNQPSVCAATGSYNQVSPPNRASHQNTTTRFCSGAKQSNQEENLKRNLNNDMRSIFGSFFPNQASTSGTLPINTMPNPKGEMKAVTARSGLAYEGPSIPSNSPLEKVVEQNTEEITDKEHSNYPRSTAQVQSSVVPISNPLPDVSRTQPKPTIPYPSRLNDQKLSEKSTNQMEYAWLCSLKSLPKSLDIRKKLSLPELTPTRMILELADRSITRPKGIAEDVFVKVVKFHFPTDFVVVDFEADLRVPLILGRSFLRTGRAFIDVYGEEITLRYNPKSSNPTLVSDPSTSESDFSNEPIVKSSSPTLTPFGESDLFLEEIKDFHNDELIPAGIDNSFYDMVGDILFLEKFLNEDPF